MKKVLFCNLIALALVAGAVKANAQAAPNYFIGKWSVLLKGLPQGDARLKFNIVDSVGHLKGVMIDTTSNTETPLTNIEQENDKVTLYFTAQGYDVNLVLNKKDDDHATGSLMGMFDAVADRIKP
ncbi:hypothetical protein [Mucilaginibacter ginsenosidivorans]|uniref:DUF4488 domain-containing protein n=1 Tax=Mucilaginibacter ginsenosidivorans TaxID=398053 RepID=A0A5B8UT09_9SPHI|nr:hypothetical protein [Mucilaginibacter ginsenosidivorans]QEC61845.1 hypothetical protein FRZ54_04340 [Mucilaginibacter ginsenosidivorans]